MVWAVRYYISPVLGEGSWSIQRPKSVVCQPSWFLYYVRLLYNMVEDVGLVACSVLVD
jgi:hypothetical protein